MTAYYNEIDPYAAQWLRNLIAAGHIAAGEVDERSIVDVGHDDLRGFKQCHFFAGIGGWSLALRLAGWTDDRPVWTGSCPCQPFSVAGAQRGSDDERHLWPAFFRLISQCRPSVVLGEQVAGSAGLAWLDHVCADLEGAGYAAAAANLCAAGAGAPHIRQRLYWVADRSGEGSLSGAFAQVHSGEESAGSRHGESERHGTASTVADALKYRLGSGSGDERGQEGAGGEHRHDAERCRGLGDSERARLESGQPKDVSGTRGRGEGGIAVKPGGQHCAVDHAPGCGCERVGHQPAHLKLVPADALPGAWDAIEWIACRDGKNRPTKPGIFPLAHGIPGRVGRLRAYGNAIVPPLAAEFIRAVMGCAP